MPIKANAIDMSDPERLKAMVLARCEPDPVTGCWNWTGCLNGSGYGVFNYDKATLRGHRVSHALFVGPVAAGALVLHSCDNARCVSPAHLRIGNQSENMTDVWDRQRARVPDSIVREIRQRRIGGARFAAIAAEFGISDGYAKAIATGGARADVGGPVASVRTCLSDADVRSIREAQSHGARTSDTAKEFGITVQHVSVLARGSSRRSAGGPFTTRPEGVHHERHANG